jgi:hypothetical protein
MPEPTSLTEYTDRFEANSEVFGYGIEGVGQRLPCPFCAAPGWAEWLVIDLATTDYEPMRRERTCAECGRSGRIEVWHGLDSVSSEFVQTGGPDAPEWLRPAPRRVDR